MVSRGTRLGLVVRYSGLCSSGVGCSTSSCLVHAEPFSYASPTSWVSARHPDRQTKKGVLPFLTSPIWDSADQFEDFKVELELYGLLCPAPFRPKSPLDAGFDSVARHTTPAASLNARCMKVSTKLPPFDIILRTCRGFTILGARPRCHHAWGHHSNVWRSGEGPPLP
jgi:hypothetical protein